MMSDPLVLMERGEELVAQQRYDTAEAIYRRLVTVREQTCGPDAEAVCPDLMALGEVLTLRGKHQEAALRLRRCYQILEALHGPHDVRLLDAASVLADALIATQRWVHDPFHEPLHLRPPETVEVTPKRKTRVVCAR
jgi:hypothetical protein